MSSTITLQKVIDLARTHIELLPIADVNGFTNEPALSLCNDVLQELLSAPFAWKFNRVEMPMLVTASRRQDYLFAGAVAFTLGSNSRGAGIGLASTPAISESGTTVTVTTLEAHGFQVGDVVYMAGNTVAAYNSTFTQNDSGSTWSGGWTITVVPSTTSFQFTHASSGLGTSGASGITNFGWLTDGTMVELNNTSSPQTTQPVEAVRDIQTTSISGRPAKVCVIQDLGTGVLKIRFRPVPSTTIWGINLVYQAKAPLKTALDNFWSPFPDELSFVYRQGFLAHAYRYQNSGRADAEYMKFQQKIAKALGADDREMSDIHVVPEIGLMDWGF
jgi:hypothetical protein